MTVSFDVSSNDAMIISQIVARAITLTKPGTFNMRTLEMDITACHANGNPLELQRMLDAPEFDFLHDAFGISRNINRTNGRLENHFSPRYSKPRLKLSGIMIPVDEETPLRNQGD